ncbi:cobalamin B12-binding domain-containing protein [Natronocella acetinitrilica]|uniref:cobalamin B12-binding domain-containing protein n=1 Tax=Natronocella acetinitrilica TaxID=414046 RepID=UPI0020A1EDFA
MQAYVHGFEKAGYSMDAICLGLLTPAAQRLGQLWKEDRCSFLDVTVGLGKLQQVLSGIGMRSPDNGPQGTRRRALLATSSGEDHTFGVQMAAEFFRRDGWAVVRGSGGRSELAAACRRYSFDLVGLSAGTEQTIDILTRDIRAIRKASCNRFVVVMVGGALFDRHPELVPMVGADAMARNGCDAPGRARQLVALAAEA